MEKNKKKLYIIIGVIVLLIILDQALKIFANTNNMEIISGILKFTTVENTGGAFGVGQNSTMTFIITNFVVLGIIIRFMMMQKEQIDKKTYFSLSLILAGGISNLIDRIFRGYVLDFIDFSEIINFPKFNLADVYIIIGWVTLALFFAIFTAKEVKSRKQKGA